MAQDEGKWLRVVRGVAVAVWSRDLMLLTVAFLKSSLAMIVMNEIL